MSSQEEIIDSLMSEEKYKIIEANRKSIQVPPYTPDREMWEVFIPRSSDTQTIFHIANHRECQQKLREQAGAEIILCDTKHMPWKSIDNGNFFEYDTFPIRIVCDSNKISDVLNIIKEHYNMSKIYAYQVSDKLIES